MTHETIEPPATAAASSGAEPDRITAHIIAALTQVLKRDLPEANGDTRLFDDLGLDSTSVLELLMAIEDELSLEFDTDTLEQHHFESVGSLAGYVVEQSAGS
ncbi:acyl carrier protein [Streptomyces sp. NBC_00525]|uniref:acyl carrier protein n=1 Tax=Streptomyces sp. NBC_00525 TaxID=2903660 RepID=UPI002E823608|nr:acyl carrier protein [Streptomyces sp. NBC_00525]WUC96305.1 acyl carrier protein [Streptomyces sp. NBC_00525]